MNITKLTAAIAVSTALVLGVAQAKENKHDEESVKSSDVPAAVMKTGEAEAKGGKIVRWEKEGANYEAVIEKSGKEWGVKIDANGKVVSKHKESKEKGENGQKD